MNLIYKYNCVEMVQSIRCLSSGTVSRLCGSTEYTTIDEYTAAWCAWVLTHCIEEKSWKNWQDCHEEYVVSVLEAAPAAE